MASGEKRWGTGQPSAYWTNAHKSRKREGDEQSENETTGRTRLDLTPRKKRKTEFARTHREQVDDDDVEKQGRNTRKKELGRVGGRQVGHTG